MIRILTWTVTLTNGNINLILVILDSFMILKGTLSTTFFVYAFVCFKVQLKEVIFWYSLNFIQNFILYLINSPLPLNLVFPSTDEFVDKVHDEFEIFFYFYGIGFFQICNDQLDKLPVLFFESVEFAVWELEYDLSFRQNFLFSPFNQLENNWW